MIAVKADKVNKRFYQHNKWHTVIADCSFEVEQGEFIVITGNIGSGKSTLLQLLGGLDRPDSGKIYLGDKELSLLNGSDLASIYRKDIGYVYQNYNLLSGLTVYENIIMSTILNHCRYDKDYLLELVSRLEISDVLYHNSRNLRNEQKQCVAICRALINRPQIILADEPTGNLGEHLKREALDLLLEYIHQYQRTLIMVTNDPEILIFADNIFELNNGQITVTKEKCKKRHILLC
ncbi:ATP-binding cassette domain-containing protein [Mobilitalea sibirica]|uniref:ATP-binding cassette domain-containing protein n=1 Tax=Mobilitalea sibirica TaxID=1462919 RepID=A0A8J7KXS8_9FIRM|nr:ATP-binding cassette domain-containing protein [Mobilitalea sibirica]MBH1942192.1 ATP-binding cassette domain-containing protein [Mobilitalea sibirica]